MFVDYYSLFEIPSNSTVEDIKSAFKKQALKWHPDRNPNIDTTEKMQLLNEAKLILLDLQARAKYDFQYIKFKKFEEAKRQSTQQHNKKENKKAEDPKQQTHKPFESTYTYAEFEVDDEILKRWTTNAKKQAVNLAKQTIEELKGMTKAGIKEGGKAIGMGFINQIIISIIVMIIIALSKTCN